MGLKDTLNRIGDKVSKAVSSASNQNGNANKTNQNTESKDITVAPSWIGDGGKSGPSSSNTSVNSYQDDINRLKELQKEATMRELRAQKEKTLQALDEQEKQIKPMYQNQRNLASANSQQGARSFAEYLANRGLSNSGAAAQGEINRQSALQNTMGQLGTAETKAYNDIATARANAENDYVSSLATANSKLEADYFNNILQENQRRRLQQEQWKTQSLGQYANDYQARINELLAQGYSPDSPEILQISGLRGVKMGNNYSNAMDNALASIQAGNINYNNAAAMGWTVEQAQNYYNDLVAKIQADAQAEAEKQAFDNYIKQQQLANDTAKTQYEINKPYYKTGDGKKEENYVNYTTHKSIIENRFTKRDTGGEAIGYDKNKILDYLEEQNLSGRMSNGDAQTFIDYYGLNRRSPEEIANSITNKMKEVFY